MKAVFASCLALSVSATAFAQSQAEPPQSDFEDEIITIGQWIGDNHPDEMTSPASLVSQIEIKNRGQSYVSDYLRSVPGIAVSRSGGAGSKTQIRIRGAEANHVLVLIDGVEVSNPSDGEFDFAGLRSADIVSIEVLRGEQSALYGSDAIGGVINIITQDTQLTPSWRSSITAGSFGTVDGEVSARIPIKGAALSVRAGALKTSGYDISGQSGEKDGSQSQSLNIALTPIEVGPLSLLANYARARVDADYDSDTTGDGWLDNVDNRALNDNQRLRLEGRFSAAGIENKILVSDHNLQIENHSAYPSLSKTAHQTIRWVSKARRGNHKLSVLGEAEHETYQISPSYALSPDKAKNTIYAAAGDYRFDNDRFTVSASARHDFNDRFADATTWKLGGAFTSGFNGLFRASLGTGIKNPTLTELFGYFPDSHFIGNPDLQPESSFGYNIGYSQTLLGGDFTASIDYFHSKLDDKITANGTSVFNVPGKNTRQGLELATRWLMSPSLTINGSATLLEAKDADGVKEIRRPDFLASLSTTWQALEAVSVTAAIDYTGEQDDKRFFFNPDLGPYGGYDSQRLALKAYTLLGINARWQFNDVLALSVRGENLLNQDYQDVVGYHSQGRGVYAGLSADF